MPCRSPSWTAAGRRTGSSQAVPAGDGDQDGERAFWAHYWDCDPCSYPDRSGDLRSVTKISDFYSARQWHGTGMYRDCFRGEIEHEMMVCLPAGPGRSVRLIFFRGAGADFSERDRGLLALLRPHLHEAYRAAERRRRGAAAADPAAAGTAAPGRRRVHQRPDRPPPWPGGGNRAQAPGKHLRQAAGLEPHRRGHPGVPGPDRVTAGLAALTAAIGCRRGHRAAGTSARGPLSGYSGRSRNEQSLQEMENFLEALGQAPRFRW